MDLSGRNYQTGGGVYPLIPFDPYQNEKIFKGGEGKMGIVTKLGEPLLGITNAEGNFHHPDDPFVGDNGPDYSAETPSTRFKDEATTVPVTLGATSPEILTERASSLLKKYKWAFLILGGLGVIYLWKNREALREKLRID
jgi:hypothetical protein